MFDSEGERVALFKREGKDGIEGEVTILLPVPFGGVEELLPSMVWLRLSFFCLSPEFFLPPGIAFVRGAKGVGEGDELCKSSSFDFFFWKIDRLAAFNARAGDDAAQHIS
jgi:hypothetical protein